MPGRKKKVGESDLANVDTFFKGKTSLSVAREAVSALLGVPPETVEAMSMRKCRRELEGVYINIFDYVAGKYSLQVATLGELRKRCKKRGIYPKERAKEEGLKILLEHLFGFARG